MTTLDIFADPVCPWCLIGRAHLMAALAQRPGHGLTIAWHPYQLDPTMPPGGHDRQTYMEAKFGGPEAVARINAQVEQAAKVAEVAVDIAAITRRPNTFDAHRLIYWAGLEGAQDRVMAGLMHAYWAEGRDIGAPEVLAEVAAAAGMDRELVARLLASDADTQETRAREEHARARGVRAVPTFVIANTHAVEGAQGADFWLQVIDELSAKTQG
ncbi:DsbA family oxidoreductase [Phaeovulum sp.]|uniref:DsbA family oxidoreductase n=1 Tax=Phaeovulum sp. TaxID=2934796 RepID=UPI003565765B